MNNDDIKEINDTTKDALYQLLENMFLHGFIHGRNDNNRLTKHHLVVKDFQEVLRNYKLNDLIKK
jgi:hypothetical protein